MPSFRISVFHPARLVRPLAVLAAAALTMLALVSPVQAAGPTSLDPNPGPVGDFAWKGFNWQKRFWGGSPRYNKAFDAANVVASWKSAPATWTASPMPGASRLSRAAAVSAQRLRS